MMTMMMMMMMMNVLVHNDDGDHEFVNGVQLDNKTNK